MEEKTQRQGGLDREVRVLPLRASRARSVRFPGGDGRRRHPDGDVASTDQSAIIGGPVLDVVLWALLKFVWVAKASRRQALNLQVLDFVDLVGLRLRI